MPKGKILAEKQETSSGKKVKGVTPYPKGTVIVDKQDYTGYDTPKKKQDIHR